MTNLSWFPFSLLATLTFGVMMALYKLPSFKGFSKFSTAFWSVTTSAVLALLFFSGSLGLLTPQMALWAFVWGASYILLVVLQMHVLQHLETNTIFPSTTVGSLVVVLAIGFLFFSESVSLFQFLGIVLGVLVVALFIYHGKGWRWSPHLLAYGIGIVGLSAVGKVVQKFAADGFDIYAFQIYQYLFAALTALAIPFFLRRTEWWKEIKHLPAMRIGSMIGVLSFIGGYFFYQALIRGPFTLITTIHSFYVLITAMVGYFLFREQLTRKKVLLIIVAIIAILLIRLG